MTFIKKFVSSSCLYWVLKLIAYNDEKRRTLPHIREEPYRILDEALYNFLLLPIVGNRYILNVAEFLDLSLKTSPCTETSPILCENQSFFLLFWNVVAFIKSLLLFTIWWSALCSLLDIYYHYLVFMDSVSGYSKSELLVKEQVLLKHKISFSCVCLL